MAKGDYLSPAEQSGLQRLIASRGIAWVAHEVRASTLDVEEAARGDDISDDLGDAIRRIIGRN